MRLCGVGIDSGRLAERGHGFIMLALFSEPDPEVDVRLCEVGLDRDRIAERGHGFIKLALILERGAKV